MVVAGKEDSQVVPAEGLSLVTPGLKNSEEELNFGVLSYKTSCSKAISSSSTEERSNLRNGSQASQTSRKQRRCWSPELHRRFVNALQQLGGSQGNNLVKKIYFLVNLIIIWIEFDVSFFAFQLQLLNKLES